MNGPPAVLPKLVPSLHDTEMGKVKEYVKKIDHTSYLEFKINDMIERYPQKYT